MKKFQWWNNKVHNIKIYEGQSTEGLIKGYILSKSTSVKRVKLQKIDQRYKRKEEKINKKYELKVKELEQKKIVELKQNEEERIKKGRELFHVL